MSAFTYGWKDTEVKRGFFVTFDSCQRAPMSLREEVYAAAISVANKAGKRPLWLCSSGGIDSEIMCQAFFDQGINFSVLTLEYDGGANRHDMQYAIRWCRAHGVAQTTLKIDALHFLTKTVALSASEGYITGNVFRFVQLEMLKKVASMGGYAVLGGGEQLYKTIPPGNDIGDEICLEFETGYAVPLEWCERNATSHEPFFYFHTPELIRAYLNTPLVQAALQHPEIFAVRNNSFLLKRIVMQSVWPEIEPRPKFNGLEKLKSAREEAQERLRAQFGEKIEVYRLRIRDLQRQLSAN